MVEVLIRVRSTEVPKGEGGAVDEEKPSSRFSSAGLSRAFNVPLEAGSPLTFILSVDSQGHITYPDRHWAAPWAWLCSFAWTAPCQLVSGTNCSFLFT